MKNFRNISLIIFTLLSLMFSLNIQSQVNNISQNRTYDADATKNVVYFIGNNECINITIDLNMMSFQDQNGNYYGYDLEDGNNYQPIPDNWDFEITNLPSPGSELSFTQMVKHLNIVRILKIQITINNLSNVHYKNKREFLIKIQVLRFRILVM